VPTYGLPLSLLSWLCLLQGGAAAEGMEEEAAPEGSKEEADARSVFVNNVDFGTTPEELQQLFAGCGTVNRVTILADKFGTPKVRPSAGAGHLPLRAAAWGSGSWHGYAVLKRRASLCLQDFRRNSGACCVCSAVMVCLPGVLCQPA
jgi:hypothetical protein